MKPKNVRTIVIAELKKIGADGVVNINRDCQCFIRDLETQECDQILDCRPAKLVKCKEQGGNGRCHRVNDVWRDGCRSKNLSKRFLLDTQSADSCQATARMSIG